MRLGANPEDAGSFSAMPVSRREMQSMKVSTYYLLIAVIMFINGCISYKRVLKSKSKEDKISCVGEYLSSFLWFVAFYLNV